MVDFPYFKYLKVNGENNKIAQIYARRDKVKLVFKGKCLLVYVFPHSREFFTRMDRSPSLIKGFKIRLMLVTCGHTAHRVF